MEEIVCFTVEVIRESASGVREKLRDHTIFQPATRLPGHSETAAWIGRGYVLASHLSRHLEPASHELMQTVIHPAKAAPPHRHAWYFVLLVIACLMFAGQGTAIKFLGRQLDPIQITFVPLCVATLLMLPLLVRSRISRSPARRLTASDWRRFIVAGFVGQFLAQLGIVSGITRSLASNAAILGLLLPVISAVLASVLLRERMTRPRALGLAIGLVGVLFLSAGSMKNSSLLGLRYLAGNLLYLAGITGCAFYNVYCKNLFERFVQTEVLVFSYIIASFASLPLLIWTDPLRMHVFMNLTWQTWLSLAYQAVVVYSAAMLLFFEALKHLDVTVASLGLYLLPVLGVALAALFLGERLGALALCGSGIVLLSTLLVARYDHLQMQRARISESAL
jgi:drug/metabolite transporter (DMT)-like permease